MPWFIYQRSDAVFLPGRCETPDAEGHVPQVTDYQRYGVCELTTDPDMALERYDATKTPPIRRATTEELNQAKTVTKQVRARAEVDHLFVRAAIRQMYEELRRVPGYTRTWAQVRADILARIEQELS